MGSKKVTKSGLTPVQEKFCQIYSSPTEFYGNGVQSYAKAHHIDLEKNPNQYGTCRSAAYIYLTNHDILTRVNELLTDEGFNAGFMDKQLLHAATQNADMGAKVRAIQEFNKLTTRIQDKLDITSGGEPFVLKVMNYKDDAASGKE